ncbi:uncharacterized protein LOC118466156 [Anopheles albimanus]|uniref:uncharacterized protein LOC118466156 n=1 Tax=Anopheles albimanus TaxID=7167 RepID=UPI0016410A3E|nr:uncharacterized protein LOC118466156 [Anopheles albimanus]
MDRVSMMCRVSSRCWLILLVGLIYLVSVAWGRNHRHGHHHQPLKYSYGIYAPTGWTVALYIWYMVKLGFILAALLLLLFAKKWNARQEPIILAGSPEYFHHRSLDGLDLLQHGSLQEATLFWRDRMEALREKLE